MTPILVSNQESTEPGTLRGLARPPSPVVAGGDMPRAPSCVPDRNLRFRSPLDLSFYPIVRSRELSLHSRATVTPYSVPSVRYVFVARGDVTAAGSSSRRPHPIWPPSRFRRRPLRFYNPQQVDSPDPLHLYPNTTHCPSTSHFPLRVHCPPSGARLDSEHFHKQ